MLADHQSDQYLIDKIYEAAAFPELWSGVLDRLARSIDTAGAFMLASSSSKWSGRWSGVVGSPRIHDAAVAYVNSELPQRSQVTPLLLAQDTPSFITDEHPCFDGVWDEDPLIAEWARKWRLGKGASGTAIHSPSGEFMVLHFQCGSEHSRISNDNLARLNLLRPHVARATLLTSRWRLERMRLAAEAIALLGLPALIIDRAGKVLAANKLIEEIIGYVKWAARDRIALYDPAADRILRLAMMALGTSASTVRSFAARSDSGSDPVVAHLIPTPGQARDLFDGAAAVLVLTPIASPGAPDATLIRGLFDLTAKEAEVARGITEGLATNEIASRHGVGEETVRTQIKSVLSKLGAKSRVEASSLLRGVPKFPMTGE